MKAIHAVVLAALGAAVTICVVARRPEVPQAIPSPASVAAPRETPARAAPTGVTAPSISAESPLQPVIVAHDEVPAAACPEDEPVPAPVPAPPASDVQAPETTEAFEAPLETPTTIEDAAAALKLSIPVEGVAASQLRDTFTQARALGLSHDAIDIMAPRGTPVRAAADGRIVKLFTSVPGGLTVYQFDPTETFVLYYAHLDSYADGLAEDQVVARGDLIGHVGSTGNANASAPHLHFSVNLLGPEKHWWKSTPINPYPLLRGAKGER